jgi:hypothetical protein
MTSNRPDPDRRRFQWGRVFDVFLVLVTGGLVVDYVLHELQWPWYVAALAAPVGGAVGWIIARVKPMM